MVRHFASVGLLIAASLLANAEPVHPGENGIAIRGEVQKVYYLPARTSPALGTILYSPGDGGWRGTAIDWGEKMASWGYDVYGIDTKRYLESFSEKSTQRPQDVTADYAELSGKLTSLKKPVVLVGWSEGASLSLLAGLETNGNPAPFSAVVAIGMPEVGILAWKWKDTLTWVTKKTPDEPRFRAADYIPELRLPFYMLHSSGDEYTTAEHARGMFAAAPSPKRFVLVPSNDHRFSSNSDGFLRELKIALEWSRHPVQDRSQFER